MSSSAWAAITKYHRWSGLNNWHLFSRSSRDWAVQDRGAGKVDFIRWPLPLARWHVGHLTLCSRDLLFVCGWRERERMSSLLSLLLRILSFSDQGPTFMTSSNPMTSWEAHLQTQTPWVLGLPCMNRGGAWKLSLEREVMRRYWC